MKTETLIHDLVKDASPVKPLAPVARRYVTWLVISLFSVAFGTLLIGPREDIVSSIQDFDFVLQAASTLLIGVVATAIAFFSSVPQLRTKQGDFLAPVILFFGVLVFLLSSLHQHDGQLGIGHKCVRNVVLLSLFPISMASWMLFRSFPLDKRRTSYLAFLGCAAVGSFSTRFVCPQDSSVHFLAWHLLPVLGLGVLGFALGHYWNRRA